MGGKSLTSKNNVWPMRTFGHLGKKEGQKRKNCVGTGVSKRLGLWISKTYLKSIRFQKERRGEKLKPRTNFRGKGKGGRKWVKRREMGKTTCNRHFTLT